MGGVFIDQEDLVALFHDDVSMEHLARHTPRLRRGDLFRRGGRAGGRGRRAVFPRRSGGAERAGRRRDGRAARRSGAGSAHRSRGRLRGRPRGGGPVPSVRTGRLLRRGHVAQGQGGGAVFLAEGLRRLIPEGRLAGGGGIPHGGAEGALPRAPLQLRTGTVGLQRRLDGVIHRVEHPLFRAEFDLLLGRVDVHVHGVEAGVQMQHAAGELAHHLLVGIGLLHRGGHGAAFHIPAVHKKVLIAPGPPAAGGQGGKAGDRHLLAGAADRHEAQGQIPAQHGVEGGLELPVAGGAQLLLPVPEEFDAHLRMGQGHPLHHGKAGRPFGGVLLHEFQAGRGIVEQVPHHHRGTLRAPRLVPGDHRAPLQGEGDPQLRPLSAGEQFHPGDGGDGRQRLPPEAQGADGLQVVFASDLAGGMAQEGGLRLPGGDAAAVVGDPDQGHAAVLDLHRHRGGGGVDGVFHEFLDHRRGPLHHFAGGDQVGHVGL